jgi:hypothetical protein
VKHDKRHSDFFFMVPPNADLQNARDCRPLARVIKAAFTVRRIERQLSLRRLAVLLAIAPEGDNRR